MVTERTDSHDRIGDVKSRADTAGSGTSRMAEPWTPSDHEDGGRASGTDGGQAPV
ncbi:hypothetical protein [Streptomyces sp. NPDC059072]|uniref:hypothetical protein n=1 Tax=Streptomyces sp. NPDC059072 TaxID=3346715 RepID=UPI003688EBC7